MGRSKIFLMACSVLFLLCALCGCDPNSVMARKTITDREFLDKYFPTVEYPEISDIQFNYRNAVGGFRGVIAFKASLTEIRKLAAGKISNNQEVPQEEANAFLRDRLASVLANDVKEFNVRNELIKWQYWADEKKGVSRDFFISDSTGWVVLIAIGR